MSIEFDAGPPSNVAELFADLPDYSPFKQHFWFDWGPVFYRGRLDRSARVLCVASDPGPTERLAGRSLVGDAGQRVQGFLRKIGLTRSYVCLNAFAYALFPSHFDDGLALMPNPALTTWRNRLFAEVSGPSLQAIVALGAQAQKAIGLWGERPASVPVLDVPHPSAHDEAVLLNKWRHAVDKLRTVVTPDPDGLPLPEQYGAMIAERDYAAVPRRDLPFGFPSWLGDDAPTGPGEERRRASVRRPVPDDFHTLIWTAPRGGGA